MDKIEGVSSQGEFGSMLAAIFNPAFATVFRCDHWTVLRTRQSMEVLDYGYAAVAGKTYLLPLRGEIRMDSADIHVLNSVAFQNYRKFGADGKD